ncbi:hypothetical protein NDU88_000068 [Pleurodeles waltl]|uniref:Uncharacterized protein n=1 Tax=Pleurodeles waltl TaxID=8319 RepID=A0AAV7TE23_PLEWA|nr:hypothetical protein NDU88_000068 [Pleurodeles waltl]
MGAGERGAPRTEPHGGPRARQPFGRGCCCGRSIGGAVVTSRSGAAAGARHVVVRRRQCGVDVHELLGPPGGRRLQTRRRTSWGVTRVPRLRREAA